ncbi:MAG: beta-ketoacyl-ACP synthase III [Tepidisphaeraceae bacterium]|jgi:3-oxoacyl-[acyl-carrier-protein] synthase-3
MADYSAIIVGTGSCVPERRLTNDDLSKMVDTNDEWITQRTGIKERRIAGDGETTATLGALACRRALEAAGLQPSDVDLIVCGTITPEMQFPSTACFIGKELGLHSTPAFDVTAACSGFLFCLDTATAFVESGRYRNVLVVGSETLSRSTDYKDRGSCILFGDGAGAVVLQRSMDKQRGLVYSSLHADGHGWDLLYCRPGSRHPINEQLVAARQQFMQIKGREVYKFAVQRFHELIEDAMLKCNLKAGDIKLIIPHQVNQRIIDAAIARLNVPVEKVYVNIARYGNTSSASIPIALDEAWRAGMIEPGDVLLFVAFGAGLTWANAVVRA